MTPIRHLPVTLLAALFFLPGQVAAQAKMVPAHKELYTTTSCAGCHGSTAMGGLGPPLAQTKLTDTEFLDVVRKGKGMMPPIAATTITDGDVSLVHQEVKALPWEESQIPIAFRVGNVLSTKNVSTIFMVAGILSLLLTAKVLLHWIKLARLRELAPAIAMYGRFRAAAVFFRSLVVDGLLVASLWRRDKFRWLMHGLMLYGFIGLGLADILMQVNDGNRPKLPMEHPLKILAVVAGMSVITGTLYVLHRYRTDRYIDNGVTLGRDFLFVNLLLHSVFSGFLTLALSRSGAFGWVMSVYIYHLATVCTLIVSMPFTRMNHIFIVPVMVGLTKVVEAVTQSGVDIGFVREPSPGRHHKSLAIADSVLKQTGAEAATRPTLRYFP